MNVINTSECEKCEYGTIEEISKAKIIVHCSDKNKTYYYGACIPCENFSKKKESEIN